MKLFPPQGNFKIYEEGFGTEDLLGRQSVGRRLSELVEKIEDPMVVALDGPWGSGKSHFLKRWVGAHTIENGGGATTVYFDAFANDFLDDPLIGLTGAIGDRLPAGLERGKWQAAKQAAFKLVRPALRVGAAVITAGASELVGPVLDAAVEASRKEAEQAAEAFWRREDGRKAAMQQFRASLARLTEPSGDHAGGGRLIVVVDELDRCRPDYALAVLEVIKHFFEVPRVHFVLGVNLDALQHIVRVRYGMGLDAAEYLKRFISLSMSLPDLVVNQRDVRTSIKYFERSALSMGVDQSIMDEVSHQLKLAAVPSKISLRDIEKILTQVALLPEKKRIEDYYGGWKILIISLTLFKAVRPNLFDLAIRGSISIESVDKFYGIEPGMLDRGGNRDNYNHYAYIIRGVWQFIVSGGVLPEADKSQFAGLFDAFGSVNTKKVISDIDRDFFGVFELN